MTEQKGAAVFCGECGARMNLRKSKQLNNDGSPRMFYSCSNYPVCRGTMRADGWGKPIGIPADAATKKMRSETYALFESYWRGKKWSRSRGYRWLTGRLGLTDRKQCSFAMFDMARCNQVVDIIKSAQKRQEAAKA